MRLYMAVSLKELRKNTWTATNLIVRLAKDCGSQCLWKQGSKVSCRLKVDLFLALQLAPMQWRNFRQLIHIKIMTTLFVSVQPWGSRLSNWFTSSMLLAMPAFAGDQTRGVTGRSTGGSSARSAACAGGTSSDHDRPTKRWPVLPSDSCETSHNIAAFMTSTGNVLR